MAEVFGPRPDLRLVGCPVGFAHKIEASLNSNVQSLQKPSFFSKNGHAFGVYRRRARSGPGPKTPDLRPDRREFNTIPRFESPYHSLQVEAVGFTRSGFKSYLSYTRHTDRTISKFRMLP